MFLFNNPANIHFGHFSLKILRSVAPSPEIAYEFIAEPLPKSNWRYAN